MKIKEISRKYIKFYLKVQMQLIQEENFVSESACKDSEFNFLKVTRTDTWEFFSETVKK